MDIPAEIQLKSTIRPGSVFYYKENSWKAPHPHFFVVINYNPTIDDALILVGATTLDVKIFYRIEHLPRETVVDVTQKDCPFLKKISYFNCNNVIQKKIEHLVEKLENNEMQISHHYVNDEVLGKLRLGVKASPQVERWIKNLI